MRPPGARAPRALASLMLLVLAVVAGCTSSGGSQLDSTMRRIALASDRDHVTSLTTLTARLGSPEVAGGAKVEVLAASQVAQAKPGLMATWAQVSVRLTDPYLSGAFGKQTSDTTCYRLEFNYFGLRRQERTTCP